MRALSLVSSSIALGGCSTACACLGPDGPPVDMAAATGEVRSVFAGTFTGEVDDAAETDREGLEYASCALAGQPFELTLEVDEPNGCGDCSSAREAHFPLAGSLAVGEAAPEALSGAVTIWSGDDGLRVWQTWLTPPEGLFPHHTMDLALDVPELDVGALVGLTWARRLSEDDATLTVWEVCALDVSGG